MSDPTSLRQALLDLGLEDLIPLPEIPTAEEIRGVLERGAVEDLATALVELLRERRIQVWSGHWSQDPEVIDPVTAEKLLRVEEQYEFTVRQIKGCALLRERRQQSSPRGTPMRRLLIVRPLTVLDWLGLVAPASFATRPPRTTTPLKEKPAAP